MVSFLRAFFDQLCAALGIDHCAYSSLKEHHDAFFDCSQSASIFWSRKARWVTRVAMFRKVFADRTGI